MRVRVGMGCARSTALAVVLAASLAVSAGAEAPPRPGPDGPEIRIQRWRIPTNDGSGRLLMAKVIRGEGEAPRALAVVNHGSSGDILKERVRQPSEFRQLSDWLVERGYVVVLPLRRGFGGSGGRIEEVGSCQRGDFARAGLEAARDIQATIDYMRTLPFVKREKTLVLGASTGGWASLAYASTGPAGVAGIVNLAGGRGGLPKKTPGKTCNDAQLVAAAGAFGTTARIPTLWLYSHNDQFFGPELANSMHASFTTAGGQGELVLLPPFKEDGHSVFGHPEGTALWRSQVERFLQLLE